MRREKKVGKIYVIYILKIGFTLLNRKNELMISMLTRYTAKVIGGNIMHIA